MRIGTFHLMGSPDMRPGEQRFAEALEQIVLAEELGMAEAWVAEHHFSNYGYSSNPLLTIAKASALTTRIRFGQAVIVTPVWHPVRLAEDVAITDILTGGRLDIGIGRGYQPLEFNGFNVPIEENRAIFEEHLAVMKKAWTETDFTFNGRYFKIKKPITVLPRPVQQPHPPIWIASSGPYSVDYAAVNGYGLLVSSTAPWDALQQSCDRYWAKRTEAGYDRAGGRIAVLRHTYVAESHEEAWDAMWQSRWQRRCAAHLREGDERITAGRNEDFPIPNEMTDEERWDRLFYGTPDRVAAQLQRQMDMGATDLMAWFDLGGLPQDKVLRSMRLFAREVVPAPQKQAVA